MKFSFSSHKYANLSRFLSAMALLCFAAFMLLRCCTSYAHADLSFDYKSLDFDTEDGYTVIRNYPFEPNSISTITVIETLVELGIIENDWDIFFDENNACWIKCNEHFLGDLPCLKPSEFKLKQTECWLDNRCYNGMCCKPDNVKVDDASTVKCKENCSFLAESLSFCVGCVDKIPYEIKLSIYIGLNTAAKICHKCCINEKSFLEKCLKLITTGLTKVVAYHNAEDLVFPLYCPQIQPAKWRI